MDYIDEVAGGLFTYDGTIFDYDWNPIGDPVDNFLANCAKKADLYMAIHIDMSTKVPIYEPGSERVGEAYDFEEMIDWSSFYDKSIYEGMKMIVYAGEFDQRDGPVTQYGWMKDLLKLAPNFWEQSRKIWYINDNLVGGYFRYDPISSFTFLTIPKAGHFVPTT